MRVHVVIRYIGMVLVFPAAFMLASAGVSLLNDHDSALYPLLLSSFVTAVLGLFPLIFVDSAEEIKTKTASDVKMAAGQSIAATKKDIETLIVSKMTEAEVKKALTSAEFVKEIIKAVAEKFTTDGPVDLEVILPESLKDVESFLTKELAKTLGAGVEASFSKKVAGGFRIGPKDGGYFISFTDETFNELISEYLRPATKKLLFG